MDNIKVIEGWILAKPVEEGETVSEGGIVLPGKKNEQVKRVEVIQISEDVPGMVEKEKGPGAKLQYGVGDIVLFYGKTGIPIEDGNTKYMFYRYDGMMAIELKAKEEDNVIPLKSVEE